METQEKYNLGNEKQEDYNKFTGRKLCQCQWDLYDPCICDFNPKDFGTIDGSFNGTIYRSFNGKLTFKNSGDIWIILSNNGSKIPLIVFRGAIKSNEFAEKLFKSFEVKE